MVVAFVPHFFRQTQQILNHADTTTMSTLSVTQFAASLSQGESLNVHNALASAYCADQDGNAKVDPLEQSLFSSSCQGVERDWHGLNAQRSAWINRVKGHFDDASRFLIYPPTPDDVRFLKSPHANERDPFRFLLLNEPEGALKGGGLSADVAQVFSLALVDVKTSEGLLDFRRFSEDALIPKGSFKHPSVSFIERLRAWRSSELSSDSSLFARSYQPNRQRMQTDLTYLTGEICEGRAFGSEGYAQAAAYVANELKSAGIQPLFQNHAVSHSASLNAYYQPFFSKTDLDLQGKNVGGIILGQDPSAPMIVLSAHLDGLGSRFFGDEKDEEEDKDIFAGANDNASGVVAALEVMRRLAEVAKTKPLPVTVAVLFFDGEEAGLQGSSVYANSAVTEGRAIRAVLNLDMLGAKPETLGGLQVVGVNRLGSTRALVERVNRSCCDLELEYLGNALDPLHLELRSDQESFRSEDPLNQPYLFFLTSTYVEPAGYHSPEDTPDRLDWDTLDANTRYAGALLWQLLHAEFPAVSPEKHRAFLDDHRLYRKTLKESPPAPQDHVREAAIQAYSALSQDISLLHWARALQTIGRRSEQSWQDEARWLKEKLKEDGNKLAWTVREKAYIALARSQLSAYFPDHALRYFESQQAVINARVDQLMQSKHNTEKALETWAQRKQEAIQSAAKRSTRNQALVAALEDPSAKDTWQDYYAASIAYLDDEITRLEQADIPNQNAAVEGMIGYINGLKTAKVPDDRIIKLWESKQALRLQGAHVLQLAKDAFLAEKNMFETLRRAEAGRGDLPDAVIAWARAHAAWVQENRDYLDGEYDWEAASQTIYTEPQKIDASKMRQAAHRTEQERVAFTAHMFRRLMVEYVLEKF